MDSRLKDCERKTAHQFKILQLREKISIKPSGLSTLNYETKFGLNSFSKHSQDIRPVNFNGGTTVGNGQTDYNYSRSEEMASLNRKTIDTNQLIMGMTTHISKKSAEERIAPPQPQGQNDWDNPFRGPNNPHLMDTVKSKDSQEGAYVAPNQPGLGEETDHTVLGLDTVQNDNQNGYKPPHSRGRGEFTPAELLSTPFLTQAKAELAREREEARARAEEAQREADTTPHEPEEDELHGSPQGDEAYIQEGEEEEQGDERLPHLLPNDQDEEPEEDEGQVIEPVTYLGGYEEEERSPAEEQEGEEEEVFTMTHKQSHIVYVPENSEPLPHNMTVGIPAGMGSFDEPVGEGEATPQGSQEREAVPQ